MVHKIDGPHLERSKDADLQLFLYSINVESA